MKNTKEKIVKDIKYEGRIGTICGYSDNLCCLIAACIKENAMGTDIISDDDHIDAEYQKNKFGYFYIAVEETKKQHDK